MIALASSAQSAIYHHPTVPEYVGNPYIEALPEILERDQAKSLMRYHPEYRDDMRSLPASQREHLASMVAAVREPTWLHGELYSRISRLICNGYTSRNPIDRFSDRSSLDTQFSLSLDQSPFPLSRTIRENGGYLLEPCVMPDANGLTFLGTSGIGKSSALKMVLGLWPDLILHKNFRGRTFSCVQLPKLMLNVPNDGSVLALAARFFQEIDEIHFKNGLVSNYQEAYIKRNTTEAMIVSQVAAVARQLGLGILVLDELQDLSPAKARKFLSFLVQIVNSVGMPIVLVGGLDAFSLVTEQFRQVRRGSSEGDLVISQAELGTRWRCFCEVLWRYQFTSETVQMSDRHAAALFDVSQGITDLLIITYKNAQIRAISTGASHVTEGIIRSVADSLNLARPALGALRRNSDFVLNRLSDLSVPSGISTQPFLRKDESPTRQNSDVTNGDQSSEQRRQPAQNSGLAVTRGNSSQSVAPEVALLPNLVASGIENGVPPMESLKIGGFGDGPLWRRLADLS